MYHIYKITQISTGKSYVGFTGKNVEKRWLEHCSGTKTSKIGKAINDKGVKDFTFDIVDKTKCPFEAQFVLEPYYIGKFDCIDNGFNGNIRLARPFHYGKMKKVYEKFFN